MYMLTIVGSKGVTLDTFFNIYINGALKDIAKSWGNVLMPVPNEPGRYRMYDLDTRECFVLKVEEL